VEQDLPPFGEAELESCQWEAVAGGVERGNVTSGRARVKVARARALRVIFRFCGAQRGRSSAARQRCSATNR
jgi:hypothetical protein